MSQRMTRQVAERELTRSQRLRMFRPSNRGKLLLAMMRARYPNVPRLDLVIEWEA